MSDILDVFGLFWINKTHKMGPRWGFQENYR